MQNILCLFSHKWETQSTAPDFRYCLRCDRWEYSNHLKIPTDLKHPRRWVKTERMTNPEFVAAEGARNINQGVSTPVLAPRPCITVVDPKPTDGAFRALQIFTMPLCRIADKLGIQGKPVSDRLTGGIWICDGSANSMAYNWVELVNRMTERMSAKITEDAKESDSDLMTRKIRELVDRVDPHRKGLI